MLTALSVARDCGIVPHGQRVIMVHTANNHNSGSPLVYFTQSNTASSPCDTIVNKSNFFFCSYNYST